VSARPDVPRLAEEELDLLISRSLDGDLTPDEEQRLERLVALDPSAARRKAELAALVADVKALPDLATPFALGTRVNANVTERAGRPGSLGGRLGLFPPPGLAKAALFVVGIVGVAIAILRPVPKRAAEGPVEVLLLNPQQPAAPAPQSLIAEAKPPARLDGKARRQETDELAKQAPAEESAAGKDAEKKTAAKTEMAARNEPAGAAGANAVAEAGSKRNVALDEGAVSGGAVAQAPAPAKIASAAVPAAPATALSVAPAAGARAMKAAATPRGWTVSVTGDAARVWALRRAPDSYPAPVSNGKSAFRVTLDASGGVASARFTGSGTAGPGLEEFVRGMVFERLERAEGALRDAQNAQKKRDAAQASAAGTEIEIELAPR
jgi:hypothetical protein